MFSVNNKGQVTFNGKPIDEMTEDEKKQAYGSAGDIGAGLAQSFDFSTGASPNFQFDPKYYEKYDISSGDAGVIGSGYRLKPEYSRMEGMTQVGVPRSVGGQGEPIDPSLITYDEEFGYITPLTNIKEPRASGLAGFLESYLPYMLAAGMGAAIAATGGLAGLGIAGAGEATAAGVGEGLGASTGGGLVGGAAETTAAASGFPAGAGIAGPTLETAGASSGAFAAPTSTATAGLGASTSTAGLFPPGAGLGVGGPLIETAGAATTVPATTQALANANTLFSNLSPLSQRIISGALSTGANAIISQRRQSSAQDFARQQQELADQRRREEIDLAYQRRREEEDRAAEARRIAGTPSAYTFNVTPRGKTGIIGSGMGA